MRNLTEVSLKNKAIVWYFIVALAIGGVFAYKNLGRMEDPTFTIRTMVISAAWPGATAEEMQEQVTDKIEKRVQDTRGLDSVRSETRPGRTTIYVNLREDVNKDRVRDTWKDVRNDVDEGRIDLPKGVVGPFYNDRFDDVYGNVYALTGDGYSYEEMREKAELIRRQMMQVESVQRVELLGVQKEKVYVEADRAKLATLGISPTAIMDALAKQNDKAPAAMEETKSDDVYLRVSGEFDDVEAIKKTVIRAGTKTFRLADIAQVERREEDPAAPKYFYNGEPAIGIEVSMADGGNILKLGKDLKALSKGIEDELPAGLELHQVANQPEVVDDAIDEFVETLGIAIVIVLAVSFFSLGIRTGLVVAGCIPLVLLGVFVFMYAAGIPLHKVSLGSLIIALGLLVDDAIIAVEMMSVKLEMGMNRFEAACYAFKATARPMLTGTLITCAGFIPVAFAKGMASEFCSTLFPVITAALILSWIASVMVAPLYGTYLIKVKVKRDAAGRIDPYQSRFYTWFRGVLHWFMTHRRIVLVGTAAAFILSLCLMTFVKQEFFPQSLRPEILVEMRLPEGSSMQATQDAADRMSDFLKERADKMENYSYYVGQYAPRFVLTIDPKTDRDNAAQFVVVAKDSASRTVLTKEIQDELDSEFPEVQSSIQFLQTGPPADHPVMLRVTGRTPKKTKELAEKVVAQLAKDPNNYNIRMDWGQKSKVMHVSLDQERLAAMGLSTQDVAHMLYTEVSGAKAAEFYTGDRTIDIDLRLAAKDRMSLGDLNSLPIYLGAAGYTTLDQIAKISYDAEEGLIGRYDLMPSIVVSADVHEGLANDVTKKALADTADIAKDLPFGASIRAEGALKNSNTAIGFLLVPIPVMIFCIMTLLMFQLRRMKDMMITLLTAPMGLIGVAAGMLVLNKAMGFVAMLGVFALSGMIIRNSVILIDQIQKHIADGESPWNAVADSAILRFRPILLTAAAAILGMVPLMLSPFWGPMAVAIASGLIAATVLTLLVLPAMYVTVYRIHP